MAKPRMSDFQFVVKYTGRETPSQDKIREVVERWLETGTAPLSWSVSVIIWRDGGRKSEVTEIDDSPRGNTLRAFLKEELPRTKFSLK